MVKRTKNDVARAEREAMKHAEAPTDIDVSSQNVDEEQVEAQITEQGADADAVLPAEAAAIHTDTESAAEASGAAQAPATKDRVNARPARAKKRSAKYQSAVQKLTTSGPVSLDQAVELVKATSYTKFDGTVELHARLALKKKDTTDSVRGLVQLPAGASTKVNVVVLTEELIDQIVSTKRIDADVYLATPALMPKVAKIARILGPQGKMPNPKTGTVTEHPETAIAEIQSGRVEYRADASGIVHVGIGKVSWEHDRLVRNAEAVLAAIGLTRLRSVTLTSTMGPGVQVDFASVSS